MERKRKREYDTVPDIYMNRSGNSHFFRPHYPVEDSDYEAVAIPDEEIGSDNGNTEDGYLYNGDMHC